MFAPYVQTIYWSRPDLTSSPIDFMIFAKADRSLSVMDYSLTITETVETGEVSLYQVIKNSAKLYFKEAEMTFDEEYEHEYEEPFLTGNLLEDLGKPLKESLAMGNYYDKQLI